VELTGAGVMLCNGLSNVQLMHSELCN